jgi:hypothetical protein
MAWVVGLSDDAEIRRIKNAGYDEVRTDLDFGDIHPVLKPDTGDKAVAVFVDCDVSELLDMKGE